MANVFDSALVASTISTVGMTVLQNRLAPLGVFTQDFSDQVKKPKDTVVVPIASETGATVTNPTNFEPGGAVTMGKSIVTLDHYAQLFAIEASELAQGHRLENMVRINMHALADKIQAVAFAPITTANFGAAVVTTTTITPGSGHLKTLWSTISKAGRKGLVVTADIYANLIPTNGDFLALAPGAYGFDNGIFFASSFTGAVASLDGFSCAPEAIVVAAAQPLIPEEVAQLMSFRGSVALPNGLTVYYNLWGSTSNRRLNASFEVMFGASAGLTTGTMGLIIA